MRRSQRSTSRGAALLLAMIVLTLVATVAAGMVWQQSRAIDVEAAERARAQAAWLLNPGVDFARDVARRQSGRSNVSDQPWDYRIDETRLAALLAADRDNSADSAVDATIAGYIVDAQSRYNLANVIAADGTVVESERKTLRRLCDVLGLAGVDELLISGLRQSRGPGTADGSGVNVPIAPARIEQLGWLGLDAATVARLREHVDILPAPTPVNVNTASREVIYAVLDGIDTGTAGRLVRQRNNRFADLEELKRQLPPGVAAEANRIDVRSRHMYVIATLRYEDRALVETALLQVNGAGAAADVVVLRRERRPALPSS